MKYSNAQMEAMSSSIEKHLERTDAIGYAAARNVRVLADELTEFREKRDALIAEYGEQEVDDDGNPTGMVSVKPDSERFDEFAEKLGELASMEHEPRIFKLPIASAEGKLSGFELLESWWMFEETEDTDGD